MNNQERKILGPPIPENFGSWYNTAGLKATVKWKMHIHICKEQSQIYGTPQFPLSKSYAIVITVLLSGNDGHRVILWPIVFSESDSDFLSNFRHFVGGRITLLSLDIAQKYADIDEISVKISEISWMNWETLSCCHDLL